MPIDNRNERASATNLGSPWRGILPLPDGSVNGSDRRMTAFHFSGNAVDAPATGTILPQMLQHGLYAGLGGP